MKKSSDEDLREKLMGLGKGSMRKTYFSELIKEKEKIEAKIEERTKALHDMNVHLAQLNSELEKSITLTMQTEKLAALGSLIRGISHEINTPLGICMTSASYLDTILLDIKNKQSSGDVTKEELWEAIMDAYDASHLINQNLMKSIELMHRLKGIAVDQIDYEQSRFNLNDHLILVITGLRSEIEQRNVSVDVCCDPELEVVCYPGILTQIMTSLLMNSLIHGFQGEGDHQIHVSCVKVGDEIHLFYDDNGIGMTDQQVSHAFDPFYTTKMGSGGNGLGLYIVYNLITNRLGGSITLTSKPGEGTHFVIKGMECVCIKPY